MELVLIGYFPKRTAVPPDFGAPHLRDLCSVSTCIAPGPGRDWTSDWRHNERGVFATQDRARAAMAGADEAQYSIHAYRMLPLRFNDGEAAPTAIPSGPPFWEPDQPPIEPLPSGFVSLGYDAVELVDDSMFFSCSPLSCNGGWQRFPTNEHCLIHDLARTIELATVFSTGGWEPGPYRVVEVLSAR